MIADLKRYPAMKDSGVSWLVEVPEHWEVGTLRRRLRRYDGIKIGPFGSQLKLDQMSDSGYKVYGQANVIAQDFNRGTKFIDQRKYKELAACDIQPGDLVVTMMGTSGRCAYVPDSAVPGIMDSHLLRLRMTADIDVRFAAKVLDEAPYLKEQITVAGKGSIMHGLNSSMIKDLVLTLPPVHEQAAVVRFLDHMDRRIRRYIRAKQKLIKLLEEQKQAIIHRAVTRGLDPNVRLKPSGVGWLGDVPEHWKLTRLKFVATQIVDCLHATPVYSEDGQYPAIRTADVQPGQLLLESARRVDEDHCVRWTSRLAPTEGDILYTREGERFGIAALVPPSVRLCISQRMMVFRIHRIHNSAYVMWQINCQHVYAQAAADLIGAAAPHVNVERIKNLWLVLPLRSEQDRIVAAVEAAHVGPNSAIARAHDEITLPREFRTRLIADVVTGKLDVREAAARLPDEVEEPEPVDETEAEGDVENAADKADATFEEAEA